MNIARYDFYYKLKDRMNLRLFESKELTDTLINTLIDLLMENNEVSIANFGKFVKETTNKKKIYNPKTKKYKIILPKDKIKFLPKKNLTDK